MQKNKEVTVVLWGRTGAGKSTLGNRLANGELFQVGHSLKSQTSNTSSKTFDLSGFKINVIDTPGFGDNRADFKDTELLATLLKTLKGLEGGFNLGIFCIPATKTRIDGHDLNEIRMLGTLLGHNVFTHTIIALTQIDTLSQSKQKEVLEHLPKQIPPILKEHGFTDFSTERILVSNFDNFNKDFVEPFLSQIAATDKYTPEISKDIDLDNPDSLAAVMGSPYMKRFLDQQKALLDEKANELSNQKALFESLAKDNKMMQASANRANQEISQLRGTIENLQKYQNSSNELIAGLAALVRTGCVLLYDASRKMWVKLTRTNLYWTTQGSDVNANYWYLVAQNANGHWNSEGKFVLDHGYFAPLGGTDWVEMQHGKVHCYFKRVN